MKVYPIITVVLVAITVVLSGCENMTEQQRIIATVAGSAAIAITLTALLVEASAQENEDACARLGLDYHRSDNTCR